MKALIGQGKDGTWGYYLDGHTGEGFESREAVEAFLDDPCRDCCMGGSEKEQNRTFCKSICPFRK